MKNITIVIAIVLSVAGSAAMSAAQTNQSKKLQQKEQKIIRYACPMHPEFAAAKPGKCPKCGMNQVLVRTNNKKR